MSWGRMDDTFHDHPKVEPLSLEAIGLWSVCWSKALRHHETAPVKGFVTEKFVKEKAGPRSRRLVRELTTPIPGKDHGMWESVTGGYVIHDFDDYLPKRRDPAEASESGRKGAQARWAKRGSKASNSHSSSDSSTDSSDEGNSHDSEHGCPVADDGSRAYRRASPSRPVPSEEQVVTSERDRHLPARPADATRPTCSRHPAGDGGTACGGCARVREWDTRRDAELARDADHARTQQLLAEQEQAREAAQRSHGRPDSTRNLRGRRREDDAEPEQTAS